MTNAGPKTGLPFNNGYKNYGHSYEGPYYSKINNECILGGLIGGGNGKITWALYQRAVVQDKVCFST